MSTIGDRGAGELALRATICAICGVTDQSDELYPAALNPDAFTPQVFSARRVPDRVHYRMVRCRRCGLVRADPTTSPEVMAQLYGGSTFDYGDELHGLGATYGRALDRVAAQVPSRHGLLDIGCGNGFVLALALARGWDDVRGVEPSADAVARAPSGLAPRIVRDIMRPGLFAPESFDAVTLFQVLDHMPDPIGLLDECRKILRPGGVILALNHNVTAWSARLLGERSPIVDVEHTYLYSPETMRRLFERVGFRGITVRSVRNTYSITYLFRLLPVPERVKASVVPRLRDMKMGRAQLTVPLGNLCLVARREA